MNAHNDMSTTLTRTCNWTMRHGAFGADGGRTRAVIYCAAEADESGYCPVHRTPPVPIEQAPRPKRDLDTDVLRWSSSDEAAFEKSRRE